MTLFVSICYFLFGFIISSIPVYHIRNGTVFPPILATTEVGGRFVCIDIELIALWDFF